MATIDELQKQIVALQARNEKLAKENGKLQEQVKAAKAAAPVLSRDEVLNWVRDHVTQVAANLRMIPGVLPEVTTPAPSDPAAPAALTIDQVVAVLKGANDEQLEPAFVAVLKDRKLKFGSRLWGARVALTK